MAGGEKIGFDRLVDWVEGRIPEAEARAVEAELARADEETRATVAWLRGFREVSDATVIASPPSDLREALVESFEGYAERKERPGPLERLTAALTFNGGSQPAFGLRSAGTRESRQLVYSTEAADVALSLFPRAGEEGLDVHGQVLTLEDADSASFVVRLLRGGTLIATTATDDLGEFSFETVPPGEYELVVGGERVEIWVPRVELRP